MGKKRVVSHARLNVMVRDLIEMRDKLLPEQASGFKEEELKDMDDFQKAKARLTKHLHDLKKGVSEYEELKKQKMGQRDRRLISAQSENNKKLAEAGELWKALKREFEKNVKKKKLDETNLAARQEWLKLFARDLQSLAERNSHHGPLDENDPLQRDIERNKKLRAARQERRRERREKRARAAGGGDAGAGIGGAGGVDPDDFEAVGMTEQEQVFMQEKAQNDEKIDELLDIISAGLGDLKELAVDIGTNLEITSEMLDEVNVKMDETIVNFQGANKKLKNLIQASTGGADSWCPILIAGTILLALIAYIVNII